MDVLQTFKPEYSQVSNHSLDYRYINHTQSSKERHRRGNIAKEMHFLRMIVPGCVPGCVGGPKETSKHECLQKTGTPIVKLQCEVADREREVVELRREVEDYKRARFDQYQRVIDDQAEAFLALRQNLDQRFSNRTDEDARGVVRLLRVFEGTVSHSRVDQQGLESRAPAGPARIDFKC